MITIPLKPIAIAYLAVINPIGPTVTLATIISLLACAYLWPIAPMIFLPAGLTLAAAYTMLFTVTFTAWGIVLSPS